MKLAPMFIAPFLSRLRGSMQSRCVQRRSPLIFLLVCSSTSVHGPHSPRQRQHVFDVYASGVGATRKRLDSFRINPTPMHGALPRLQAAPGRPAIMPHEPYAKTMGRWSPFLCIPSSRLYSFSSLHCALMAVSVDVESWGDDAKKSFSNHYKNTGWYFRNGQAVAMGNHTSKNRHHHFTELEQKYGLGYLQTFQEVSRVKSNTWVTLCGSTLKILQAILPPQIASPSGIPKAVSLYSEVCQFLTIIEFKPWEWLHGTPSPNPLYANESAPVTIVGGSFYGNVYVPDHRTTFGGYPARPLLPDMRAILVRLYEKVHGSTQLVPSNLGIVPLVTVFINEHVNPVHDYEGCHGRSVCLIPGVKEISFIENPPSESDVFDEAKHLACHSTDMHNPARCEGCGNRPAEQTWRASLSRCFQEMSTFMNTEGMVSFYLFSCPMSMWNGGKVTPNVTCNRLIISKKRVNGGTSNAPVQIQYGMITTVSRFMVKVAQMQMASNGSVDATLLQDLTNAGYYKSDEEFRALLSKMEGVRVRCHTFDIASLQTILEKLFSKGYMYRRFAMSDSVAVDVDSETNPKNRPETSPHTEQANIMETRLSSIGASVENGTQPPDESTKMAEPTSTPPSLLTESSPLSPSTHHSPPVPPAHTTESPPATHPTQSPPVVPLGHSTESPPSASPTYPSLTGSPPPALPVSPAHSMGSPSAPSSGYSSVEQQVSVANDSRITPPQPVMPLSSSAPSEDPNQGARTTPSLITASPSASALNDPMATPGNASSSTNDDDCNGDFVWTNQATESFQKEGMPMYLLGENYVRMFGRYPLDGEEVTAMQKAYCFNNFKFADGQMGVISGLWRCAKPRPSVFANL